MENFADKLMIAAGSWADPMAIHWLIVLDSAMADKRFVTTQRSRKYRPAIVINYVD